MISKIHELIQTNSSKKEFMKKFQPKLMSFPIISKILGFIMINWIDVLKLKLQIDSHTVSKIYEIL